MRRFSSLLAAGWLLPSLLAPASHAMTEDARELRRNEPGLIRPAGVSSPSFTGASRYRYPLEVPAGAGGLTPQLVLVNSSDSPNSEYGYGWTLAISAIERNTRLGPPDYLDPGSPSSPASVTDDTGHRFELDGQLLVRDPNEPGRFHPRAADGSRILYLRDNALAGGGYWEVTRGDGTRLLYGARPAASSTLARRADGSEVFRWALDEVVDARGNAYRIDYERDLQWLPLEGGGTAAFDRYVYPKYIRYSFHYPADVSGSPVDPHAAIADDATALRLIEFVWGARGDVVGDLDHKTADRPTSYRAGFRVQRRRRLTGVRVGIVASPNATTIDLDDQIRRYELRYAPKVDLGDPATSSDDVLRPNSELVEIVRYGRGDHRFPSSTRFEYTAAGNGFLPPERLSGTLGTGHIRYTFSGFSIGDAESAFFDLDGDGFLDRIGGGSAIAHGGLYEAGGEPQFGLAALGSWVGGAWDARFDSVSEIEPRFGNPLADDIGLSDEIDRRKVADFVDMNGDGFVDRVEIGDCNDILALDVWCVYFNDGASLAPGVPWDLGGVQQVSGELEYSVILSFGTHSTIATLVDVNGDGRPDWFSGWTTAGQKNVFLNTGTGFDDGHVFVWNGSEDPQALGELSVSSTWGSASQAVIASFIDLNGDGLVDQHVGEVCLGGGFTRFGLGAGWQWTGGSEHEASQETCSGALDSVTVESSQAGVFSSLLDMNGDGVPDLVVSRPWLLAPGPGPSWSVLYGLGDGRFLYSEAIGASTGGQHWEIPGYIAPEAPTPQTSSQYWIRYDEPEPLTSALFRITRSDTLDVTGDGMPDHVIVDGPTSGPWGEWHLYRHPGRAGLLARVTNENGGVLELEYEPASTYAHDPVTALTPGAPPLSEALPTNVIARTDSTPVLSRILRFDGLGGPAQSEAFRYAGARIDIETRERAGFRMVEQVVEGLRMMRQLFHQDPARLGRLQLRERSDPAAAPGFEQLLASEVNEWSAQSTSSTSGPLPVAGSWLVTPVETRIHRFDPVDPLLATTRTITRSFDPETGTLSSEMQSADGHLRSTEYEYVPNEADWIVALPSTVREVLDGVLGPRIRLLYDGASSETSPPKRGLVTELARSLDHDGASYRERIERFSYDGRGNPTAFFDGAAVERGDAVPTHATQWDSVLVTFPTRLENAVGDVRELRFDPGIGLPLRTLDAAGQLRCNLFDFFGRPASRSQSSGSAGSLDADCDRWVETFIYFGDGDPLQQHRMTLRSVSIGEIGETVRWPLLDARWHDGFGRVHREHQHAGGTLDDGDADYFVRLSGYDALGRKDCVSLPVRSAFPTAPLGCRSQLSRRELAHDALGRATHVDLVAASGVTRERSSVWSVADLDPVNGGDLELVRTTTWPTQSSASPDREIAHAFDTWGRIRMNAEQRNRTHYERDARGRIVAIESFDLDLAGSAGRSTIVYDHTGARVSLAPPGAPGSVAPWSFDYDASGNLIEQTAPGGQEIRFEYDQANRLVARDRAPFAALADFGPEDDVFGWHLGRIVHVASPGLESEYDYYPDGRIRLERRTFADDPSLAFRFLHAYDVMGRPALSILPDSSWIAWDYDGALPDRIRHSRSATPVVEGVAYHDGGGLASLEFPGLGSGGGPAGLWSSYEYDSETHRLSRATTLSSDQTFQDIDYQYDTAGNLLSALDASGGFSQVFDYDAYHRLTRLTASGSLADGAGFSGRAYQYDAIGNLLALGDRTIEYGPGMANPSGSPYAARRVTSNGVLVGSYFYDVNGDATLRWRIGEGVALFERDDEGRLSSICRAGGGACWTSVYDAAGDRVRRRGAGLDRLRVTPGYEVDLVAGTHEVHFELAGRRVASALSSGVGTLEDRGELLSLRSYHPDHVGTAVLSLRSDGAPVQRRVATPFGELLLGGTAGGPLLAGADRDEESGLDAFGQRYYDSSIGRFLSPDPELVGAIDQRRQVLAGEALLGGRRLRGELAHRAGTQLLGVPVLGTSVFDAHPVAARLSQARDPAASPGWWPVDVVSSPIGSIVMPRLPGISFRRGVLDAQQLADRAYTANRPTRFVDADGRFISLAAAGLGGLLGGIGGGSFALGVELGEALSGDQEFDLESVAEGFASGALIGAVSGALAGAATGDLSALAFGAVLSGSGFVGGLGWGLATTPPQPSRTGTVTIIDLN